MVGRPSCTTHTHAVTRTPKPSVEIRVDHLHWCCSEVRLKTQLAECEACQTGNMSSDPEAETVNTLAAAAPSSRPPITASRKLKLVDLALTHEPSCQHRVHKLGRGSQQKRWLRHCPSTKVSLWASGEDLGMWLRKRDALNCCCRCRCQCRCDL